MTQQKKAFNDEILRAVKFYVTKLNWPVFPVSQTKTPLVKGGYKAASTDHGQINRWFKNPNAVGIGVPTGERVGFFVLDIDGEKGADSLKALEDLHGPLPETLEVITGRKAGGRHLYFRFTGEVDIRNSASKLGAGLDIRGTGGYVIVPPSLHPSGNRYRYREGHKPLELSIAEAPSWLIDRVKTPEENRKCGVGEVQNPLSTCTPYGRKALADEVTLVRQAPEGQRNDTLNRAAYDVGQLVAGGEISRQEAEEQLRQAALASGLRASEVEKTLASGINAGLANPRSAHTKGTTVKVDIQLPKIEEEEPLPLYRSLPASESFPIEALGCVGEDVVRAIMNTVQVPASLAANTVLAVMSLAVQGIADIQLPFAVGRPRPVSLFLVTIAHSSDRKTTADEVAVRAVRQREEELSRRYTREVEDFHQSLEVHKRISERIYRQINTDEGVRTNPRGAMESVREELRRLGDAPQPPLQPIILLSDITFEGLTKHLRVSQPSIGIFSSEGGQLVGGYAMNEDNKRKTGAGFCCLWDGQTLSRARAGDDLLRVSGRRVSLHLMLQPSLAAEFLSDTTLIGISQSDSHQCPRINCWNPVFPRVP